MTVKKRGESSLKVEKKSANKNFYEQEIQIVKIRQIGNSRGLIIPNNLISKVGIKSEVVISYKDGIIQIKPLKIKPRDGWASAFQKMRNNNDDELLIPDMFNDEYIEEYDKTI